MSKPGPFQVLDFEPMFGLSIPGSGCKAVVVHNQGKRTVVPILSGRTAVPMGSKRTAVPTRVAEPAQMS